MEKSSLELIEQYLRMVYTKFQLSSPYIVWEKLARVSGIWAKNAKLRKTLKTVGHVIHKRYIHVTLNMTVFTTKSGTYDTTLMFNICFDV